MEDQLIPYELEVKLKELGCYEFILYTTYDPYPTENKGVLWQQAFDWFRKTHYLYTVIIPTITMYWTFKTTTVVESMVEVPPYNHVDAHDYPTYEEARLTCLKRLIELVENTLINKEEE